MAWLTLGIAGRIACLMADAPLPSPTAVTSNLLARAQRVAENPEGRIYVFTKKVISEDLDARGRVKERTEKQYLVTQVAGISYPRLIRVNGKIAGDRQASREAEEDAQVRREFGAEKPRPQGTRSKPMVTPELLARYDYRIEQRETLRGRATLRVSFWPASNRGSSPKIIDQILNRCAGTIWVDEEDAEVVKAAVTLREGMTFWGGILGALDKFELALERARSEDGAYFNQQARVNVRGRKLFDSMRIRATEEATGFRRVPALATSK